MTNKEKEIIFDKMLDCRWECENAHRLGDYDKEKECRRAAIPVQDIIIALDLVDEFDEYKWDMRYCDDCGRPMKEGYCVDGGSEYYCSDECLHKHYTPEEWDEMYEDGGDNYYTEWY